MKFLLATCLTLFSSVGFSAENLHSQCWDQTFAYNYMTVDENDETLEFSLEGSSIMPLVAPNHWQVEENKFSLDKNHCNFSTDKKLLICGADKVEVTTLNGTVEIFYLSLEIHFVERENAFSIVKGFELKTRYFLEKSTENNLPETFVNTTFFPSERTGCSNN